MRGSTGFLVTVIILLVGVLAYMMGQQGTLDSLTEGSSEKSDQPAAETSEPSIPEPEPAPVRAVKVGTQGPNVSACKGLGYVANLPETGGINDFLAVRHAPTTRGEQIDKLGNGHPIVLCDQNESGSWIGIVYENSRNARVARCGAVQKVASARPYDGPCQSGWVYSKYVEVQ